MNRVEFSSKVYLVLFLGLLCFGFWDGSKEALADSATALSLAPHTFDIPGVAGERIRRTVKIRNNGNFAIPLRARVANFDAEDGTGKMVVTEHQEDGDFSGWFTLDQNEVVIDAGATEKFSFSIDVPRLTPDGGYYAMIVFETDISPLYINGTKTQILPSAGVLVMLYVGDAEEKEGIAVEDYQIAPESRILWAEKGINYLAAPFLDKGSSIALVADSRPAVTVRLKNNGMRHVKLDNTVKILGFSEEERARLDLPSITILPGKSRLVAWSKEGAAKDLEEQGKSAREEGSSDSGKMGSLLSGAGNSSTKEKSGIFAGPARARLVVAEEGGDEYYQADRFMFVMPWKAAAIIAFGFAVFIIWFFWRRRKKHDKIFKALVYKIPQKS